MLFDLNERDQRADTKPLVVFADLIEPTDLANVDQARRAGDAVFHQIEQIDAAGFERRLIGHRRERLIHAVCIDPIKAVHAVIPFTLPSAASTVAGRIGSWRTRTPVAL